MTGKFDVFFSIYHSLNDEQGRKLADMDIICIELCGNKTTMASLKPLLFDYPQFLKRIESGLYKLPLEELGLSETTIQIVQNTGITSIGDCVDFFERDCEIIAPHNYSEAMYTQVKPKLEEFGYLPSVGNGDQ